VPTYACPYCSRPTLLPAPWTAPGFTCAHCQQTVLVAVPVVVPVEPPDPSEDPGDEPAPDADGRHRNRTRARLTPFALVAGVIVIGVLVYLLTRT
jgi:hypothetical protein